MGSLRFLLAIVVVCSHVGIGFLVGPRLAVQVFYTVSGFLIAFILDTVKAYKNPRRFYENRALRLYPLYFTVALLCLILSFFLRGQDFGLFDWRLFSALPRSAQFFLAIVNVTIVGQDWVMFSGIDHGHLAFVSNFRLSELPLHQFLLIDQAWTLGLEISFYAIAPFILRRTRWLAGLFVLSCIARGVGFALGFRIDPWSYRFFPFELSLFLLGSLSYKIYARFNLKTICSRRVPQFWFCLGTMIVLGSFSLMPKPGISASLILFLWIFVALPFLFHFQQNHSFDALAGDLSYPIYIGHMFVLIVLLSLRGAGARYFGALFAQKLPFAFVVIVASIGFAILLKIAVADPVEQIRRRMRVSAPVPHATAA
jgi:peptidoglycan/LPS O-acetylase OafA/YrhL